MVLASERVLSLQTSLQATACIIIKLYRVIFAIFTSTMPDGISEANSNPRQQAQALERTHANRHMLCK